MFNARVLPILGFIFIGVFSRLIPHPPNFTALIAVALFAGLYLENCLYALSLTFATLFISDCLLGFHSTMFTIYLSFGLITVLGYQFRKLFSWQNSIIFSILASLFFFVVSNFGVWMFDAFYTKNLNGLISCYLAALPFLSNQMLGDLVYSVILMGYYYATKKNFYIATCSF